MFKMHIQENIIELSNKEFIYMKIKKLIPLLVCGAFLVTGCQAGRGGKVSNVKQKVAKGSLISQRFLSQNYGGEEANNGFTFDSARSGSDLIPSGYSVYNINLMQYGFVMLRNETNYYYALYCVHTGTVLRELSNSNVSQTRTSNYVGVASSNRNPSDSSLNRKLTSSEVPSNLKVSTPS